MGTVRLQNPQHSACLLRRANEMRLSGTLCDAVIVVESRAFQAHSLVLACTSKHLEALLKDQGHRCTLDFLSWRTFQQILDYAYTEALEARVEDLQSLMEAAERLQMEQLGRQCLFLLATQNTPQPPMPSEPCLLRIREAARKESESLSPPVTPPETSPKRSPIDGHAFPSTLRQEPGTPGTQPRRPQSIRRSSLEEEPHSTSKEGQLMPPRGSVIATAHRVPTDSKKTSPWTTHGMALANGELVAISSHPSLYPAHLLSYQMQGLPRAAPPMFPMIAHSQLRIGAPVAGFSSFSPFRNGFLQSGQEPGAAVKQSTLDKRSGVGAALLGSIQEDQDRKHQSLGKTFSCEICGKEFQDGLRLQMHAAMHSGSEGPQFCPLCRKRFDSQGALTEHIAHHTSGWSYCCTECRKTFTSHSALRRHLRAHAGEAGFECEFCGRCFRDDSSLKNHKRSHTGEKPYECSSCAKKFSLKHQLETHTRVHTGEKPFQCKVCHQRSRDYSAMIKHLRTHNGAAPYQCTVCLEYCSSLSAMQKHVKAHAPEDIPPDWSIDKTYLYTCSG
ncbi:zinc finger and BTB domain-containing protein 16-like [Acipenser ruthenus]|uniref:zinc finger and BTB domain-containing protein 16-like n=1 Tax=Acipenser ruthenus TaxID=7906 RepID=UPI0027418FE3|nr:zinc finger and BTB domain-containing protein 16-like [Acipenser ruthenus]